ncbi:MAG TPA: 23S rRNA (guanosine(2251)-2'-O)-methyltransferase RlmB [Accumulibacter sp.]|nr:23S rRNA (guanosine(2251)-2'-O)-methyltransferase RlmB [Accumulibacter sp.]
MSQNSRLIFGFHSTLAKLRHDPGAIREIYVDAARHDARLRDLVRHAEFATVRVLPVDRARLQAMAPGARHQGVIATVDAAQRHVTLDDVLDTLDEPAFLLVLDGIQDPHNLGACLRVADAVGAHAVIAPKDRAVGLTQTAVKVASGAAETVPYVTVTNLARTLRELKEREIWVVGTDADADDDLYTAQWPTACAWVLGAEGDGLRRLTRDTCDQLVNIPMLGSVASLNVSVATGVCLYEARRRRAPGSTRGPLSPTSPSA